MRTTIDLPEDLHRVATAISRDAGTSLSETVSQLVRSALSAPGPVILSISPVTGLLVASGGPVITSEDVRCLEDEA